MKIVNGAIIQSHTVEVVSKLDEQPDELLLRGIVELRERFQSVSGEIFSSIELDTLIPGVNISVPKIGDKKKLIDLSMNNARYFLMEKRKMDEAKKSGAQNRAYFGYLAARFALERTACSY
jgi:excinuclease ABC subunit C